MRLCLTGHDFRFAVEQMLLTLFPGQLPEYGPWPPEPGQLGARVELERRGTRALARAVIRREDGRQWSAVREGDLPPGADGMEEKRLLQHLVRMAFYTAGTGLLGGEPPWGALTGVRPVKLPTAVLRRGGSEAQAAALLRETYRVSPPRVELAMACARAAAAVERALAPDEVSLYVGVPFCPTRCAYCSFICADIKRALALVEPYLAALEEELAAIGAALSATGRRVRTVYVGGGTPTTLDAPRLDRLLGALAASVDLSGCTEYTVEAGRPDTITEEKLAVLRAHRVDRVSVNPQSMDDRVLRAIGRAHTAEQTRQAYRLAADAGFAAVNMDVIAGLPADTAEGFARTLDELIALAPANITVHTLTLKKGAALFQQREDLPGREQTARMLEYAWPALAAAGYAPYYLYRQKYMSGAFENVGWCKPGAESAYNICMMEELHPVLAAGAGGVSKLTAPGGRLLRLCAPKYPDQYLEKLPRVLADKARAARWLSAQGSA